MSFISKHYLKYLPNKFVDHLNYLQEQILKGGFDLGSHVPKRGEGLEFAQNWSSRGEGVKNP